MTSLLLSLGHNSSAIAVDDQGVPLGYEEERLTKIKSDSAFPEQAILEIGKHVDLKKIERYYVSSWFNGFDPAKKLKYWDPHRFRELCPRATYVDTNLTHHDMHAWSALAFTEHYIRVDERWHILVVDGFGTDEEVISVYTVTGQDPKPDLAYRISGYQYSLGLLFQYAAEHQGMDGINDVYKYLGYRAQLDPAGIQYIKNCAQKFTLENYEPERSPERCYPIDLNALKHAKQHHFMKQFEEFNFSREEMGYFLQMVLEETVTYICDVYDIKNLMVAGGCFYNVRLNGVLAKKLDRLSVMPLAGDQGAAIGAYRKHIGIPRSFIFGDLCWGVRPSNVLPDREPNFVIRENFGACVQEISYLLSKGWIVNVMRGPMEYGPRALCHTSTLAPPTMEHVKAINTLNGRSTVMPMAPVMTQGASRRLFGRDTLCKVYGTDHFMVCAHEYKATKGETVAGAALNEHGVYTGRPQIVDAMADPTLYAILEMVDYECLINTSLNLHGTPIAFDHKDLLAIHRAWLKAHTEDMPNFMTFYVEG